VAIEEVYVWNNTSIMQDEVLCHRIGLIPLKIDPRSLKFPREFVYPSMRNAG
jgi:DNA-directed RNA polymerase I and III subunit RPAC1